MPTIAFVLSPLFQVVDLSAATAFQLANTAYGKAHYTVSFVSEAGGDVVSDAGITVGSAPLTNTAYDTVFLIGGVPPERASDAHISLLRQSLSTARRLAASGTATLLLAETGILDGRRATTHWTYLEMLKQYPSVAVDPDSIFVRDGEIWTSAGMTAALDLALALIEDDLGTTIAKEIAKQVLLFYRRPGGQSQISTLLEMEPRTDRIRRVLGHARKNLRGDLSVEELADVAHLSPRQFSRLFREETGQSPAKAIEVMRIEAARSLLKEGRLPLETIAQDVGFIDRDRMCKAFVRQLGQTPTELRDPPRATIGRSNSNRPAANQLQRSCAVPLHRPASEIGLERRAR